MHKLLLLAISSLVSLGVMGIMPKHSPRHDDPPPPKKKGEPGKKEKGGPGPAGDLRKAYDLLRRIKADDGPAGRPEDRLRDWTDRAAKLYRLGVKAHEDGDPRIAREYGTAAHDLARAVDHARNASRFDRADLADLPAPPGGPGPDDDMDRVRRDLQHAYDRIQEARGSDAPDAKFYLDAARDLYNAARSDAERNRVERAGELARAAEAMTHVPEHLAHAADRDPTPAKDEPRPPEPPKGERPGRNDLPPVLPPR
jgi:hypothetical protein